MATLDITLEFDFTISAGEVDSIYCIHLRRGPYLKPLRLNLKPETLSDLTSELSPALIDEILDAYHDQEGAP